MSKRQQAESQCRDCHEPILWATSSTGGSIPLNIRPERITGLSNGPFYILNELTMVCSRAQTDVIEVAIERERKLFTNHLVTCEKRQTDELRRKHA